MDMHTYINEIFYYYKIEKWNKNKKCWEFYKGFYDFNSAIIEYISLLKNYNVIFRLIKIIEFDEV